MSSNNGTLGVNLNGNVEEQVNVISAFRPLAAAAGANNGEIIDRQKFNSCLFKIITGALEGTPTTSAVVAKIQHDTDSAGGTMADAAAGGAGSEVTVTIADAANANQAHIFADLHHLNRYIRIVLTPAFTGGSTPKVLCSAACITGEWRAEGPVTQEAQT